MDATKTSGLESPKRRKNSEIGDGRVLYETRFGKSILKKIVEHGATASSGMYVPKVHEEVFDGKVIRVGVLEQDILNKIKKEFEEAKNSGIPGHVRLPGNLFPLNVKTVNMVGEKTKIKVEYGNKPSPIFEKVKAAALEGEEEMIKDGIVPKIPLTPINMYEVLDGSVVASNGNTRTIEIKTKSGSFCYQTPGLDSMFKAAIAKIRMDGNEKDYVIGGYCAATAMLARLLPLRHYVSCDKGIINIGDRRDLDLEVDGRLLVIGATFEKILDDIKEKWNGTRVVHYRASSIQAILYQWIQENEIMTIGIKKEIACYYQFVASDKIMEYNTYTPHLWTGGTMEYHHKLEHVRGIIEKNFNGWSGAPFSSHTSDMITPKKDVFMERVTSIYHAINRRINGYKLKYEVIRVYGNDAPEFLCCWTTYAKMAYDLNGNNSIATMNIRECGKPEQKGRKRTGAVLVVLYDKWNEYVGDNFEKISGICEDLRTRYKRFELYFELPDSTYFTQELVDKCKTCDFAFSLEDFCSNSYRYWLRVSESKFTGFKEDRFDTHFQRPLAEGYGNLVKYMSLWFFGERVTYGSDLYKIATTMWYWIPFRLYDTLNVCENVRSEIEMSNPGDYQQFYRDGKYRTELGKSFFFKYV